MKKEQGITIRYSISFKQKVVREFEDEGLSIAQLSRRYKIKGGGTVKNWVIKYGNNDLLNKIVRIEMKDEKDRVKELEEELKRVKLKLADTVMHRDLLETLVDISSKHYKVDIKKNFGEILIEAIKALAREKELSLIALDVWSFNIEAHAFFAKQGFTNFNDRMWLEISK